MEEILFRFPHIAEDIFKELNGKNFFKAMEVTQSWKYFIDNQRVLQNAYKFHKAIQKRIESLAVEAARKARKWKIPKRK